MEAVRGWVWIFSGIAHLENMLFFEMKGKLTNCVAFVIFPWPHIAGRQLPFPMPNSCSSYV